jgi:hypothetical protein
MLDVIRVWKVRNYPFPMCSLLFLFLLKFLHPPYNWIFMKKNSSWPLESTVCVEKKIDLSLNVKLYALFIGY